MCLFKRKNTQKAYLHEKQETPSEMAINRDATAILWCEKQETPPEVTINEEAVAVVWSEDKKNFGEIFFQNGAYKYVCWQLCYDEDFTGYYWTPIYSKFTSFFDTLEKAKQAADDLMQGK